MRTLLIAVLMASGCHREPGLCGGDWPAQLHQPLDGRAYDVAVAPGVYVLALSVGVAVLDACTLAKKGGCDDALEARRLSLRSNGAIADYLRRDGTAAACDLTRSTPVAPAPEAIAELRLRRGDHAGQTSVWIENGRAWLQQSGGAAQALALSAEPLDVRLSGDTVAVSDRAGVLSLFSSIDGSPRARRAAHARNAYAVAFDAVNHRLVSVAGPGQLTLTSY